MLYQVHKFFAGLSLVEGTCKIGSSGYGILFLYPTHLHAHMLGFDYHHHTQRIQCLLDALLNLKGHAFLHLQTM
jgi:hypothetical protein